MEQITITGNLGKDAVIRTTGNNDSLANFSVGVNRRGKDKNGSATKSTVWYSCTWWNPNKVADYLKKGQKVMIQGQPNLSTYTNQHGQQVSVIEIRVTYVELLSQSAENRPTEPRPAQPQQNQNARDGMHPIFDTDFDFTGDPNGELPF